MEKLKQLRERIIKWNLKQGARVNYENTTDAYYYATLDCFSKRETTAGLRDIYLKFNYSGSFYQKRKYKESFFPYKVVPKMIFDKDDKLVFCQLSNTYGNPQYYITEEFWESRKQDLNDHLYLNIHNLEQFTIVTKDNLKSYFFKEYKFTSIKEANDFKALIKNEILKNYRVDFGLEEVVEVLKKEKNKEVVEEEWPF